MFSLRAVYFLRFRLDDWKDATRSASELSDLAKHLMISVFSDVLRAPVPARQRCEFKTFEIRGSASGRLRSALLGKLSCTAAALRPHQGIVGALACLIGPDLTLALAQRGHLGVDLPELRVHDLAYQHARRACIASSAEKMAASTASRSRCLCLGIMAAVIR
jgi:hypothetical protein